MTSIQSSPSRVEQFGWPSGPCVYLSVRFDVDEPSIMVATGRLDERISTFMRLRGCPMTAREIFVGIASNASQVNRVLRLMACAGEIEVIDIPGSVKEYVLK